MEVPYYSTSVKYGIKKMAGTSPISWITGTTPIFVRPVTIDHTKVPSTQTDFAFPVFGVYPYLKTVSNGGNVQNSSGFDIKFTSDAAGTTNLSWEMESYNPVSGSILAWVKVPSVSSAIDTVIYLQYGNPSYVTFQGNVAGTWSNSFLSVWHMNQIITASGQTVTDSVGSFNMTSVGTWTSAQQTPGKLGGCLQCLFANGNYLTYSNIALTTSYTISGWINITDATNASHFLGNSADGQDQNWFAGFFRQFGGVSDEVASTTISVINTWTHYAITRNGVNMVVYLNGVNSGTSTNGNSLRVFNQMGRQLTNLTSNIQYSKVRTASTDRSQNYITAEYNSQFNPATFHSIGAVSNL